MNQLPKLPVEFFQKPNLDAWNRLGEDIKFIEGIDRVINITKLPILTTDSTRKRFNSDIWYHPKMTSYEIDSAVVVLKNQDIYKGMFYNENPTSGIMLVDINMDVLSFPERKDVIDKIVASGDLYSSTLNNIDVFGK